MTESFHQERFCFIDGRRYTIGQVVLDLKGTGTPKVHVADAEPDAWRWFVARVNPNCDERAERSLKAKGVRVFRPLERIIVFPQGKRTERERNLFPRYLFAGLATNWRGEVDCVTPTRCDGVEGLVRTAGRPVEVGEHVVVMLQIAQNGGEFDRTGRSELPPVGSEVRIKEGPLAGFIGLVAESEPDKRIELLIEMFGRKQRVRFEAGQLEAV